MSPDLLSVEGMRNLMAALERDSGHDTTDEEETRFVNWIAERTREMECLARIAAGHKGIIRWDGTDYSATLQ